MMDDRRGKHKLTKRLHRRESNSGEDSKFVSRPQTPRLSTSRTKSIVRHSADRSSSTKRSTSPRQRLPNLNVRSRSDSFSDDSNEDDEDEHIITEEDIEIMNQLIDGKEELSDFAKSVFAKYLER